MQFESILFYRFLFACMALGGILLINGQSFRISRRDIPSLLLLAILYLMSAVFLFWGYKFMASGVATTIHFMYPVLTTLVMMLFFKEKVRLADSRHRLCRDRCLLLIRWKYRDRKFLIFRPFHRSFISIGICTVPCHNEPVKDRPDERITAHFLCLSFRRNLSLYRNQQYQPSSAYQRMAYCRKSNLAGINPDRRFQSCTGQSSKSIGSTLTSVLGAMEPVTAVCVGIFSWRSIHHKYWRRHCTDYRCCNGNYTETIRAAFL